MILSARPTPAKIGAEVSVVLGVVILGIWLDEYTSLALYSNIVLTLLTLSLIGSVAFIGYYSRSKNWRSTETTRAVMRLMLAISLILFVGILSAFTGPYRGEKVFAIALYGWLTYSIWRLLIILRVEQIRASRHPLTSKER